MEIKGKTIEMSGPARRLIFSLVLLVSGAFVWLSPPTWESFDREGDEYFASAITKATASYAVVRIVNKLVSVPQEGAPLGVGQVLDPINDATERLSEQLSISIAVLGVMKIATLLLRTYAMKALALALVFMGLLVFLSPVSRVRRAMEYTAFAMLTLVALRMALPVAGRINSHLMDSFFGPRIDERMKTFDPVRRRWNETSTRISGLMNFGSAASVPQSSSGQAAPTKKSSSSLNPLEKLEAMAEYMGDVISSLIDTMKDFGRMASVAYHTVAAGASFAKDTMVFFATHGEEVISSLLGLMVLYAAILVIQVIVIPLGLFFFFKGLLEALVAPAQLVAVVQPAPARQ